MENKNTADIDKNLISQNIYALYEDGEFTTTANLKEGWIMLIDIGRWRHTIMTNPRTTPDALNWCGLFWESHAPVGDGTYLIIDDDWMVHQSIKPSGEDFENIVNGTFYGLMEMEERFYMNPKMEFIYIK